MTRVGLIGAGNWGRNWLRSLAARGVLGAVCDSDTGCLAALAARYPELSFDHDSTAFFARKELDAVVIATPATTHFSLAREALRAGKHVLVEKPLAKSAAEAQELLQLAQRVGRVGMVGHILLYHPAVVHLKRLIDAGELGTLHYIHSQRLNLGQVRRDENAMWSLAPHDIALVGELFGAWPIAAQAVGASFIQRDPAIEDVVFLTLNYASGQMAHCHVSWLDPHKTRRLTVVGSRKMAVFDDMAATETLTLYDKGVIAPSYDSYGDALTLRTGDILMPKIEMSEPLTQELSHFLACIENGTAPRSDFGEGLSVLRVLEACTASLRQGGTPISLDA